ncbi:MAG TPA: hypothetical protein PKV73_14960 [Agriterribacter sp.]|nr:hypothetical protein [Chitinophagaceae bacterium]HRP33196.1 hypothetical protein [Agriterribacter sp.]
MLYTCRKILLILIITAISTSGVNAQTVNDIPIKDIDVEYIQIIGTSKPFSKGVSIQIDFGQKTKFFSTGKETVLKDKDGKIMDFNSMIDALNFMAQNGFEFVNAFAIAVSNQNVYHYLLKNIKKEPE